VRLPALEARKNRFELDVIPELSCIPDDEGLEVLSWWACADVEADTSTGHRGTRARGALYVGLTGSLRFGY